MLTFKQYYERLKFKIRFIRKCLNLKTTINYVVALIQFSWIIMKDQNFEKDIKTSQKKRGYLQVNNEFHLKQVWYSNKLSYMCTQ